MSKHLSGTGPILCARLLRKVDAELIRLLPSLAPGDWDVQTIVPSWKVRDVAAHLLDTHSVDCRWPGMRVGRFVGNMHMHTTAR